MVDSLAIAQCANVSMAIRLDIQNSTDEGYDLLECDLVIWYIATFWEEPATFISRAECKIEAKSFFKVSVSVYQTVWHHIPEECNVRVFIRTDFYIHTIIQDISNVSAILFLILGNWDCRSNIPCTRQTPACSYMPISWGKESLLVLRMIKKHINALCEPNTEFL